VLLYKTTNSDLKGKIIMSSHPPFFGIYWHSLPGYLDIPAGTFWHFLLRLPWYSFWNILTYRKCRVIIV